MSMVTRKRKRIHSESSDSESDMNIIPEILRANRRECPHCGEYLTLKTIKAHKRLYFNKVTSLLLAKQSKNILSL